MVRLNRILVFIVVINALTFSGSLVGVQWNAHRTQITGDNSRGYFDCLANTNDTVKMSENQYEKFINLCAVDAQTEALNNHPLRGFKFFFEQMAKTMVANVERKANGNDDTREQLQKDEVWKFALASAQLLVGSVVTVVAAVYLSKLIYGVLNHWLTKDDPINLFEETNWAPWYKFFGKSAPKDTGSLFFASSKLRANVERYDEQIGHAIKTNGELSNAFFYGEPGTGKTLIAKQIARKHGAYYFITSGARFATLAQDPNGAAIKELDKLFRIAEKAASSRKVLVFIDEADVMLKKRHHGMSPQHEQLLTAFLAKTEKASNANLAFIFATNLPESIDPAVVDRVGKANWIHFERPDQETRKKMIEHFVKKALLDYKMDEKMPLSFDIDACAEGLAGKSGRSIEEFCKTVVREGVRLKVSKLDAKVIGDVLDRVHESESDLEGHRQSSSWVAA